MKKLILLQPYGLLAKGDPMQVSAGVAEQLIKRGIARVAADSDAKKDKRGGRK